MARKKETKITVVIPQVSKPAISKADETEFRGSIAGLDERGLRTKCWEQEKELRLTRVRLAHARRSLTLVAQTTKEIATSCDVENFDAG